MPNSPDVEEDGTSPPYMPSKDCKEKATCASKQHFLPSLTTSFLRLVAQSIRKSTLRVLPTLLCHRIIVESFERRLPCEQCVRGVVFDKLPPFHKRNLIEVQDGVEPVSDCNDGMSRELLANDTLHQFVRLGVNAVFHVSAFYLRMGGEGHRETLTCWSLRLEPILYWDEG